VEINSTMDFRSISFRPGAGARALHWLTAILVVAAYVVSKGDRYSLYSSDAGGIRRVHETLGTLVFVVVVAQLLWRLINIAPAKQPMPRWAALLATLVRLLLYTLLIAVPATAVLGTWLMGLPMTLVGLDVPSQIARAHELGQQIMKVHTVLGDSILWVAGGHAAAALFHHFVLRDNVLRSMTSGE
jgi:cytochrome b561